jgi:predicted nucleic acid-binding protein
MNPRYGIDTSIMVRLLTGDPPREYRRTVAALEEILVDQPDAEIFASNQVIGEAYVAVQHHCGVSKQAARSALHSVLASGLVACLNGAEAGEALQATGGCGLLDRLIVQDYHQRGLTTLTQDRKMAALPQARRLPS